MIIGEEATESTETIAQSETKPAGSSQTFLVIVLFVMVLGLLGFGLYFYFTHREDECFAGPKTCQKCEKCTISEDDTPVTQPSGTSGWKTYDNIKFNVHFKYPTDWTLVEKTLGGTSCPSLDVRVTKSGHTFYVNAPCGSSPSVCIFPDSVKKTYEGISTIEFTKFDSVVGSRKYRRAWNDSTKLYEICAEGTTGEGVYVTISGPAYIQYLVPSSSEDSATLQIMDKILQTYR